MSPLECGLYVVATPIGNLGDITLRGIEVLMLADRIACEDTRVTRKLLSHHTINTKVTSYHDHNANTVRPVLIQEIKDGKSIALVCDAGMPSISDPGYKLVNKCRQFDIEVISIPGPSSLTSALSISGLPSDSFYFEGFLPKKKGRKTKFEFLSSLPSTIVIFESPYRLVKTVQDIFDYMSNREICICKELTKVYERVMFGNVLNILELLKDEVKLKGEYVIIIAKEGYVLK